MDVKKRWSSACGWCCFFVVFECLASAVVSTIRFPGNFSVVIFLSGLGADRWISDGMKGSEKRSDVYICGQLCGGVEFHAEVSVSGSDVTSAHLEFGLAHGVREVPLGDRETARK